MDKQLLVDYTVFEVTPQAINESLTQNNGKLIVSGVLQRAEAKNQKIYLKISFSPYCENRHNTHQNFVYSHIRILAYLSY